MQTKVLALRAHKIVYRNLPQLFGFIAQAIILGTIIGLTYFQLPEVRESRCMVPLDADDLADPVWYTKLEKPELSGDSGNLLLATSVLWVGQRCELSL